MGKIKLLPVQLTNQIAAGEVVERPASAVKELLENSIDAGATKIEVSFSNGGKSMLVIEDNGKGMLPDDALLCFQRYATSKLQRFEDLHNISSFGFRGEALPSIASVSKMNIETRHASQATGMKIQLEGGNVISNKPCGRAVGTRIEVASIFYNVPVRKKFLKDEKIEASHIVQWVRLYALAHPEVYFLLKNGNKKIFSSPPCNNLKDRVAEIWPRKDVDGWIECKDESDEIKMHGLISPPGKSYSNKQEINIFVNGRPLGNSILTNTVRSSFQGFTASDRHPGAFLFLNIEPSSVDVNVHPSKLEVRFRQEAKLKTFLSEAIKSTLSLSSCKEKTSFDTTESYTRLLNPKYSEQEANNLTPSSAILQTHYNAEPAKESFINTNSLNSNKLLKEDVKEDIITEDIDSNVNFSDTSKQKKESDHSIEKNKIAPKTVVFADKVVEAQKKEKHPINKKLPTVCSHWRFLNTWGKKYAFFDTGATLILMDCKAALRRTVYNKAYEQFKSSMALSQTLLMPFNLEIGPIDANALENNLDFLNETCGFKIRDFGKNSFYIESVPSWIRLGEEENTLMDLINLIHTKGNLKKDDLSYKIVSDCISNKVKLLSSDLTEKGCLKLLTDVFNGYNKATCPKGIPILKELFHSDIESIVAS